MKAKNNEDKLIKEFKTECCKAPVVLKSRANWRCSKCDKDYSLEFVLLYDLFYGKR